MAILPTLDRQVSQIRAEDQPVKSRFVKEPTYESRPPRIRAGAILSVRGG